MSELPLYVLSQHIFPKNIRWFITAALFDYAYVCKHWRDAARISMRADLSTDEYKELVSFKKFISKNKGCFDWTCFSSKGANFDGCHNALWFLRDQQSKFELFLYGVDKVFVHIIKIGSFAETCCAINKLHRRRDISYDNKDFFRNLSRIIDFVLRRPCRPNLYDSEEMDFLKVLRVLSQKEMLPFFKNEDIHRALMTGKVRFAHACLEWFPSLAVTRALLSMVIVHVDGRHCRFQCCLRACVDLYSESLMINMIEKCSSNIRDECKTDGYEYVFSAIAACIPNKTAVACALFQLLDIDESNIANYLGILVREYDSPNFTPDSKHLFVESILELFASRHKLSE